MLLAFYRNKQSNKTHKGIIFHAKAIGNAHRRFTAKCSPFCTRGKGYLLSNLFVVVYITYIFMLFANGLARTMLVVIGVGGTTAPPYSLNLLV